MSTCSDLQIKSKPFSTRPTRYLYQEQLIPEDIRVLSLCWILTLLRQNGVRVESLVATRIQNLTLDRARFNVIVHST